MSRLAGVVEVGGETDVYSPPGWQRWRALLWSVLAIATLGSVGWMLWGGTSLAVGLSEENVWQGLVVAAGIAAYRAARYWKAAFSEHGRLLFRLTAEGFELPGRRPNRVLWRDVESVELNGSYQEYHVRVALKPDALRRPTQDYLVVDDRELAITDRQLFHLFEARFQEYRREQGVT